MSITGAILDTIIGTLPPRLATRAGYKLLRAGSREARAYLDLFVSPFAERRDWKSGLGDTVRVLYDLARALRPRTVVEIGSARGRSTCALALA